MTWAKFSDDFADDCWNLSDAAFRLHVEALCWNGRKLLDCRIPKADLRRFAKHSDAMPELLAVGWWTDDGDVYVIRHHAGYQRTRAQVLAQQAANVQNGRRGGRPRKPRELSELSDTSTETQSLSESQSERLDESKTERDRTGQDRTGTYEQVEDDEIDSALTEYRGGPVPQW